MTLPTGWPRQSGLTMNSNSHTVTRTTASHATPLLSTGRATHVHNAEYRRATIARRMLWIVIAALSSRSLFISACLAVRKQGQLRLRCVGPSLHQSLVAR